MSLTKAKYDPALLMTTLKFSADDLRVNHTGVMTNEQQNKLRTMRLGASILPIIFMCGAAALVQTVIRDYANTDSFGWRFIGSGAFLLAVTTLGAYRWLKVTADLRGSHIAVVVGEIRLSDLQTRNIGYYGYGCRMNVEGVQFIVPWAARKPFLDGTTFLIYYAPNSKIILSAEDVSTY